ncbi:MAG: glycoside hydrolase family 18 protein, partial [Chlamydiae bacterium]|nr:glycoside hydrolase family 18 protein [Chlamydiota bacterium]
MIKKIAVSTCLLLSILSQVYSDNLIAGYLDTTAAGSALKVSISQANQDGYNMVIFGFAKINTTTIDFYDSSSENILKQKLTEAKNNNMKTLVSVGGQSNTFNPGVLSTNQISELATNIVTFIRANNLDGIDFDIEVKTDPNLILILLHNIKQIDTTILITAAPQINNGKLVTTADNQDYQAAIDAG